MTCYCAESDSKAWKYLQTRVEIQDLILFFCTRVFFMIHLSICVPAEVSFKSPKRWTVELQDREESLRFYFVVFCVSAWFQWRWNCVRRAARSRPASCSWTSFSTSLNPRLWCLLTRRVSRSSSETCRATAAVSTVTSRPRRRNERKTGCREGGRCRGGKKGRRKEKMAGWKEIGSKKFKRWWEGERGRDESGHGATWRKEPMERWH